MNELVGDLDAERSHEIRVTFKEADMLVIRDGYQSVNFDGKVAPIFEEQFDRRHRHGSFEKFAHEGTLSHALLPALNYFLVDFVDVRFGVVGAHLDAKLRCNVAHRLLLRLLSTRKAEPFDPSTLLRPGFAQGERKKRIRSLRSC